MAIFGWKTLEQAEIYTKAERQQCSPVAR